MPGEFLEVPGDAVRFAQFGRLREHPGVLAEGADQVALALVGEQREVGALGGQAEIGGVARDRRQSRVGVLHVVDRVLVRGAGPQFEVDVDALVHRGPHERVARGVDADRLDEVVESDDGAGPLAHLHGLATADEVDHLADHHLDGVGVVAEGRRGGLEARDVAVVVGPEHVDAQVEAARALVLEVGDVAGDVGGVAVGLDDDAVLVVAVVGALEPPGAVVEVQIARRLEGLDGLVDRSALEEGVLVEVHVEVDTELVEGALDVREHQVHADRAEGLVPLGLGEFEGIGALLEHGGGDVDDVRAASRPRGRAVRARRR